jgi:restriction endonuclease S subunit
VGELRARISSLESQLKAAKESVGSVTFPPASSGSYEEALMEEMEKMKKGFEKKIAVLTEDYLSKEREQRRREIDLKTENEKVKWEKGLLLKKFDMISK